MDKSRSTIELRAKYKAALQSALLAGYGVLSSGGEAMDAVVAAVSSMEGACDLRRSLHAITLPTVYQWCAYEFCIDCPLFNAGRGAVFNTAGKVSSDLITSACLPRSTCLPERTGDVSHALQTAFDPP